MSTFLELCAALADESGAIGAAPTSVLAQTGRQAKAVGWVRRAYELIQNSNPDWTWMQAEIAAVALVINQTSYTAAQLGIASRFAGFKGERIDGNIVVQPWTIYDNTIGVADESPMREIEYEKWRLYYDRGAQVAQRPYYYARAPDDTLRLGPKPDKTYRVRGEYRKSIQTLAANADVPEMPLRFHDIIVWRAVMLLAGHDESDPAYQQAAAKYGEMLADLQRDCLPRIVLGGTAFA